MLVGAAACGDRTPPLQQTARPANVAWIDSLISQPTPASPMELGLAAQTDSSTQAVKAPEKTEEKPSTSSSTRRHRSSSSSSGARRSSSSGSSGTYSAPQGRVVTRRNTTRDAAIGAGAGAVIGAVAGGRRHRVRGAVVGAVVGGAAGAVIGTHVDKQTRVEY
jgi:hypothetical protein